MDANGHHRRRIFWAIVAILAFAWIRLSIGLENMIYLGDSIYNDPHQATEAENIGALADGLFAISSMVPLLCFTLAKLCTGAPLLLFAIGMVIYHSIKMGQHGSGQLPGKPKHRKEKNKHV